MAERCFDAVIPIGGWCRPTYQVRRYFDFKTAYPFDWLICPTPGLIAMLDDDFKRLLQPERLRLRQDLDGVTCENYDIHHKHDFLRDKEHNTLSDIDGQIEEAKSKYYYRLENLRRDAATGSVLFIRYDDVPVFDAHEEAAGKRHRRAGRQDAADILAALRRLFPNADVTLLALNFDLGQSDDPALLVGADAVDHGDRSSADYAGSDKGWDDLFASAGVARRTRRDHPEERRDDVSGVGASYW